MNCQRSPTSNESGPCFDSPVVQRIVTRLVDDLTGEELAEGVGESVSFGLDGQEFFIDLTSADAARLRGALQEYVAAAAKVGAGSRRPSRRQSEPSARELRDWARANGHQVPDRGRVPTRVRDAFLARR
jgi:Lsr2